MMEHIGYRDAKRHVERRLGFLIHLAVYTAVNAGLVFFNLSQRDAVLWSVWPLAGWGIGLLFHGAAVFLNAPGSTWKQRMIEKELEKHRRPPAE